MSNTKPSLLSCALSCLRDECPAEPEMYLCTKGEDDSLDCQLCWERYLFWVANGRRGDPYKWDKIKEEGV